LRRCTRARFATSCEKVTGGWKKLCVGGRSRLAGRRWSFSTGACCRGCAGQGTDHGALNGEGHFPREHVVVVVVVREPASGDGNFPRGYVVVAVGIRKTMSGLPEAAVIFGRGMLAWYWWFGSPPAASQRRRSFSTGVCCRRSGDPEDNERPTRSGGHFWAGHVAVVVVVRGHARGFPAAKVIFHGSMFPSQWGSGRQ
jgi:hypothetical protein